MAFLRGLAVGGDAGDPRTGTRPFRQAVEIARVRAEDARDRSGCVWVFESEETEEADAEVTRKGTGSAAGAEAEEGRVVFVDEVACRQEDEER